MAADRHVVGEERLVVVLARVVVEGRLDGLEVALRPVARMLQLERVLAALLAVDDSAAASLVGVEAEVRVRFVAAVVGVGVRMVGVGVDAELLELRAHGEGQVVVLDLLEIVGDLVGRDQAGRVHELAGDRVVVARGVEVREAEALLLHLIQRRGQLLAYRVGGEALRGYHHEVVALEESGVGVLLRRRAVLEILVHLLDVRVLLVRDERVEVYIHDVGRVDDAFAAAALRGAAFAAAAFGQDDDVLRAADGDRELAARGRYQPELLRRQRVLEGARVLRAQAGRLVGHHYQRPRDELDYYHGDGEHRFRGDRVFLELHQRLVEERMPGLAVRALRLPAPAEDEERREGYERKYDEPEHLEGVVYRVPGELRHRVRARVRGERDLQYRAEAVVIHRLHAEIDRQYAEDHQRDAAVDLRLEEGAEQREEYPRRHREKYRQPESRAEEAADEIKKAAALRGYEVEPEKKLQIEHRGGHEQ